MLNWHTENDHKSDTVTGTFAYFFFQKATQYLSELIRFDTLFFFMDQLSITTSVIQSTFLTMKQ